MKRVGKRFLPLVGFLVFINACNACRTATDRDVAEDTRRYLNHTIRPGPAPLSKRNRQTNPPRAAVGEQLFIDASVSMAGFGRVARPNPYIQMIDALANTMHGPSMYRYGQRPQSPRSYENIVREPIAIDRRLSTEGFYSLPYNPDDLLIENLAASEATLTALVTDGVYSDREETTLSSVVEAIAKWFEEGRSMAVLVVRSGYAGDFYSELQRAVIPWAGEVERPFYVLLFGPDEETLSDFIDRLSANAPQLERLMFSHDSIDCDPPEVVRQKSSPFVPGGAALGNYEWRMISREAIEKPVKVVWRVRCEADSDYPALFTIAPRVTYERWDEKERKPVAAHHSRIVPSINMVEEVPGMRWSRTYEVEVPLTADRGGSYSFYTVAFLPKYAGAAPKVRELSTTYDNDPDQLGRTYYFSRLIGGVAERHFAHRLGEKPLHTAALTVPGMK